jgi:hypothetical protein
MFCNGWAGIIYKKRSQLSFHGSKVLTIDYTFLISNDQNMNCSTFWVKLAICLCLWVADLICK